ncbi:transposase [Candidatus Micrarchaeota archaeon]|nr:transposase [Candidatus Micrarchaeota archaeon]
MKSKTHRTGRPKFKPYWKEQKQQLLVPKQKKIADYPKQKQTYTQNWFAYDLSQTKEATLLHELAYSLCYQSLKEEPSKVGRPRLEIRERIFCMLLRVYFGKSSRRLIGFLQYAVMKGYLQKVPSYPSICRFFRDKEINAELLELLIETSKPLKEFETVFAVDASGFGTSLYAHYFNHEYRKHKTRKGFLKLNVMIGVKTHIVTAAIVSKGKSHEIKDFPNLVDTTAKNFKIDEVSADSGYVAYYNYEAVVKHGGTPFILFKANNTLHPQDHYTKSEVWLKMLRLFHDNNYFFMQKYHKRSNIETVFSMIKKKLNPNLKSKDELAQKNELLCNLICHNLIILIHEMFESGLEIPWLDSLCQNSNDCIRNIEL